MQRHRGILSLVIAFAMALTILAVPTDAVAAKKTAAKKTSSKKTTVKKKKTTKKKAEKPAKLRSVRDIIEVGQTTKIVVLNRPSGAKVSYSSADRGIAAVSKKGVVRGKAVGRTTIRVKVTRKKTKKQKAYNKTLKFQVKVTPTQYDQDKAANFGISRVSGVSSEETAGAYPYDVSYKASNPRNKNIYWGCSFSAFSGTFAMTEDGHVLFKTELEMSYENFNDGLARFTRNVNGDTKYGVVDYNGKVIIDAEYSKVTEFLQRYLHGSKQQWYILFHQDRSTARTHQQAVRYF